MKLFSFFKPKPKLVVDTRLGPFTLVYSKNGRNTWSGNLDEITLTVKGSEIQPDLEQIAFLADYKHEINKLDLAITKKLKSELSDAGFNVAFQIWQDRFKLISADVMVCLEKEAFWNITLADQHEPYAHFTLFIEGNKLTDVSIDT